MLINNKNLSWAVLISQENYESAHQYPYQLVHYIITFHF